MSAVKDVALVPAQAVNAMAEMFERLATNPAADADKLEKLIQMHERILARNAEASFNQAFLVMQADIPEIDERGAIRDRAGNVQSTYAKNEDIQATLRPILQRHGFTLSFETQWLDKSTVKLVGILTHRDGHARRSEFVSPADATGSKNAVQGLGSSISYGHRYTTIDLLNIICRALDDDGRKAGNVGKAEAPAGFEDWVMDLSGAVPDGTDALRDAWKGSPAPMREHLLKTDAGKWEVMKREAAKASAKARS